ncbi:hypothetical protein [Burkholderia alba]|uniref:hypothetical protein n=1 Tax=Burkholderia alba TaxID=2683677 RepID=UPI002B0622FB|nr:hypothetical protein [Burkholderia alba]
MDGVRFDSPNFRQVSGRYPTHDPADVSPAARRAGRMQRQVGGEIAARRAGAMARAASAALDEPRERRESAGVSRRPARARADCPSVRRDYQR